MNSSMLMVHLIAVGLLLAACGQQAAPAPAGPSAPTNPPDPSAEPLGAEQPATGANPLAGTAWHVLLYNSGWSYWGRQVARGCSST